MAFPRRAPALLLTMLLLAAALPTPADAIVPPLDGRGLGVRLVPVASGLSMPLLVTHAGDGSGRLFVVEQTGLVKVLEGGTLDPTPYLDVRGRISLGGERGLLGLAFDPRFATTGRLYASYTDASGDSVLERFVVGPDGRPDASAGEVLLRVPQPYPNHNGGHVAFGPDGHLYWGLGDGGSAGDPLGNAQRLDTLLGKILRLDVRGASGYAVPADNPFPAGGAARPEIWAYGLRNPWRFSFDRATGDLFIGDVGQNLWEEVNHQRAASPGGQNYGWNEWEGNAPYRAGADARGKTFPILDYPHGLECSVTGGVVVRDGDLPPTVAGSYLFADYCSGVIWTAREVLPRTWRALRMLDTPYFVSSFGEDEEGNVYVVHHFGSVHRLDRV